MVLGIWLLFLISLVKAYLASSTVSTTLLPRRFLKTSDLTISFSVVTIMIVVVFLLTDYRCFAN
jgi:hypothetical protein